VATLYFGKEVLMPVTLALLLAFVLAPMVNLLRRAHLGRVPSVLLGVTLGLCVVLAIGGVIGSQIGQLTTDIPKYAATVETKVSNVRNFTIGRLSELADKVGAKKAQSSTSSADGSSAASPQQAPTNAPAPAASQASGSSPFELAERYLSPVLSPFATFGIVFIVAVFALLQKEDLRDRMIRLLGSNDLHGTTVAIDDGCRRLSRYFLTQLIINTAFGIVIGAGLLIIGLPNPVLWGILSALLRFVPYVGSLISALLPVALASSFHFKRTHSSRTADGILCGLVMVPTGEGE
jgi:predicted PurR-regulated permease PerM